VYLVTSPDPKSPNFRRIATSQVVELDYIDSEDLKSLLPDTVALYVKFDKRGNRVTVTAPKEQMEEVVAQIKELDTPPIQVMVEALVVDVENTGERWLRGSMWAELYDSEGKHVGKYDGGKQRMYPGTSVRFSADLVGIQTSSYKALIVIDCGGDDVFGANVNLVLKE
jgi:type II secretory pathway component GspD/PulD (secretin)